MRARTDGGAPPIISETQQVIVNVVNVVPQATTVANSPDVPDWWKIYEGLSDDEVDELHQAIRQRADLTRDFE